MRRTSETENDVTRRLRAAICIIALAVFALLPGLQAASATRTVAMTHTYLPAASSPTPCTSAIASADPAYPAATHGSCPDKKHADGACKACTGRHCIASPGILALTAMLFPLAPQTALRATHSHRLRSLAQAPEPKPPRLTG